MWRNLFLVLIFPSYFVYAQESNYANYEVGANSTMMGGAVTAGVRDNSAVYYNPGALAFVETTNVTLETGYLFGGPTATTSTIHNQIYVVLGLSYKFE